MKAAFFAAVCKLLNQHKRTVIPCAIVGAAYIGLLYMLARGPAMPVGPGEKPRPLPEHVGPITEQMMKDFEHRHPIVDDGQLAAQQARKRNHCIFAFAVFGCVLVLAVGLMIWWERQPTKEWAPPDEERIATALSDFNAWKQLLLERLECERQEAKRKEASREAGESPPPVEGKQ